MKRFTIPLALAALAALAPMTVRAAETLERLERAMLNNAPKVIAHLKNAEKDKRREGEPLLYVGVLKFAVQKGDAAPEDNVGPLNLSLAHRLETALLLSLKEEDKIGLLERPSAVIAAVSSRADHQCPRGRKALFALKRFRLAWGTGADATNRGADVFLCGLARLSSDLRTLDVTVRAFDRTDPARGPVDVVAFKAAIDTRTLVETGESFLIRRDLVKEPRKAPAAALSDTEAFAESRNEILGKKTQHPGTVGTSPVTMKVFYGEKEMVIREQPNRRAEVDEPKEKTQVTFQLHNTSTTDRYGVVLLVNGVSTLFEEDWPPPLCRKWILDPGEKLTVKGFQDSVRIYKKFEVAPVDQAMERFHYGEYAGTFQTVVFLEDKNPKLPPPPTAEEEREDGVGRAPMIKDKDKRPETLEARQQGVLHQDSAAKISSKGLRGLVVAGAPVPGAVVEVPFTFYQDPVMSSVIYYYRPKGSRND